MKRPATSSIVVFVVILLVTALIVAAVGLGTDGATAITVGDRSVSAATVNDELAQWAAFAPAEAKTTPGAVASQAGAGIANQIVYELLAEQFLAAEGERVTQADRAEAAASVAQVRRQFEERPQWFQDRYLRRLAVFTALTRVAGEDDRGTGELRVLRRQARRAGVTVDPAYGRWGQVRAQVTPYPTPFTPQG